MNHGVTTRSDRMGRAVVVRVGPTRATLCTSGGETLNVTPRETFGTTSMDLTEYLRQNEDVVFKADLAGNSDSEPVTAKYVRRLRDCYVGRGKMTKIQSSFAYAQSSKHGTIFMPVLALLNDPNILPVMRRVRDLSKFLQKGDPISFVAVHDKTTENRAAYAIEVRLELNADEENVGKWTGIICDVHRSSFEAYATNFGPSFTLDNEILSIDSNIDLRHIFSVADRITFRAKAKNVESVYDVQPLEERLRIKLDEAKHRGADYAVTTTKTVTVFNNNYAKPAAKKKVQWRKVGVTHDVEAVGRWEQIDSEIYINTSKYDFILFPPSVWHFDDVPGLLTALVENEYLYVEATFNEKTDQYEAIYVDKTVSGVGVVEKISSGYAYMVSPTYGRLFFAGTALDDALEGLINLTRVLREGDQLQFLAVDQRGPEKGGNEGIDGCNYKAGAVRFPPMVGADGVSCVGIVTQSNFDHVLLYCRPLGTVSTHEEVGYLRQGDRVSFLHDGNGQATNVNRLAPHEQILKFPQRQGQMKKKEMKNEPKMTKEEEKNDQILREMEQELELELCDDLDELLKFQGGEDQEYGGEFENGKSNGSCSSNYTEKEVSDAECQCNILCEADMINDLMRDEEISSMIMTRFPSLCHKWFVSQMNLKL